MSVCLEVSWSSRSCTALDPQKQALAASHRDLTCVPSRMTQHGLAQEPYTLIHGQKEEMQGLKGQVT